MLLFESSCLTIRFLDHNGNKALGNATIEAY